jgi:hypothetical protein
VGSSQASGWVLLRLRRSWLAWGYQATRGQCCRWVARAKIIECSRSDASPWIEDAVVPRAVEGKTRTVTGTAAGIFGHLGAAGRADLLLRRERLRWDAALFLRVGASLGGTDALPSAGQLAELLVTSLRF